MAGKWARLTSAGFRAPWRDAPNAPHGCWLYRAPPTYRLALVAPKAPQASESSRGLAGSMPSPTIARYPAPDFPKSPLAAASCRA